MATKRLLTILQMSDTHAYFDIHQEMFWRGYHIEYRKAEGYPCASVGNIGYFL